MTKVFYLLLEKWAPTTLGYLLANLWGKIVLVFLAGMDDKDGDDNGEDEGLDEHDEDFLAAFLIDTGA